ncbi:MAG: SDR family NAD(P)-dependent oxidoreductase [Hyphomicrobiaceae bacterium]|jgi:NAD(P)-dependent dehydrogenase (short-subunit alcohol dehydrogenase family)
MGLEDLSGKRAIITGAAGGIGRAIAAALVGEGVRVVVADRDGEGAARAASELGRGSVSLAIDVADRASVEAAFVQAIKELGGLDLLCANAGVSTMCLVEELSDEDWDFNMNVNARGVFLTNQAAVRHWRRSGTRGVIVNTASLAGKWGAPWLAHYSASKFAVVGFTQALAREMAPHGIRVNCVCPGFVKTSMQDREVAWEAELRGMTPGAVIADYVSQTPLGRLETAEDVAKSVVFLASDLSGFITGEALNVTGGVRMD